MMGAEVLDGLSLMCYQMYLKKKKKSFCDILPALNTV